MMEEILFLDDFFFFGCLIYGCVKCLKHVSCVHEMFLFHY